MSGSIHYFRVPQELWQDRLRKIRAGGYNAIQFVIPWNIHEPLNGQFDFDGQNDLISFIELAKKEDLYILLRPGPYICAGEIEMLIGQCYWLTFPLVTGAVAKNVNKGFMNICFCL